MAAVLEMLYQPQSTYSSGAVFKLHEVFHEPLRSSLIKFLNVDITSMKNVFICFKHFDDVHLNKEDKRIRLKHASQSYSTVKNLLQKLKFHGSRLISRLVDGDDYRNNFVPRIQ